MTPTAVTTTPNFFYVQKSCDKLKKYPEGLSGRVIIKILDTETILLERPMKVSENFRDLHKNYWELWHDREVVQKMVLDDFAVNLSDFQDKRIRISTRIYNITIREKPYEANKSEEQQSAADVNPEKYNKLCAFIVRIVQTTNIESGINNGPGEIRSEGYLIGVKNKETSICSRPCLTNWIGEAAHNEIFG